MTEPLLKTRDVAELLGVEMGTVIDYFQAGDLPGFRLRGRKGAPLRFRLSEVEAWLENECRPTRMRAPTANGPAARKRPGPDTGKDSSDAIRILRPAGD